MKENYYKLAVWVERFCCFQDGKRAYQTEGGARADAKQPGKYRVSLVAPEGRTDYEPFIITGGPNIDKVVRKQFTPTATRPMGGRPH